MYRTGEQILVGDVGGTNVRLGLMQIDQEGKFQLIDFFVASGAGEANFDSVMSSYLDQLAVKPKYVSLGLAGPKTNGEITLISRNWTVSETGLTNRFGFEFVQIFHDFTAMARSVPEMSSSDFKTLAEGTAIPGEPILVAGAGTGFGTAVLTHSEDRWQVISGEGGHQAYAPQTHEETELLHILQETHDFVSLELVCSGRGMDTVHAAICKRHNKPYKQLSPAIVYENAKAGDPVCLEVCEVRSAAIMGGIGDMAASFGARGGVVLAGGVSERLLGFIDAEAAMKRFRTRGPLNDYINKIPIRLLRNQKAALYGAAALFLDTV